MNEKKKKRSNRKIRKFTKTKFKKKEEIFQTWKKWKKRRYKNLTQKGRCETQFKNSKNSFENLKFCFLQGDQKRNRKTMRLFKTNGFLDVQKIEAEGKKSRKTKRQENIDPKREISDEKRTETKNKKMENMRK